MRKSHQLHFQNIYQISPCLFISVAATLTVATAGFLLHSEESSNWFTFPLLPLCIPLPAQGDMNRNIKDNINAHKSKDE